MRYIIVAYILLLPIYIFCQQKQVVIKDNHGKILFSSPPKEVRPEIYFDLLNGKDAWMQSDSVEIGITAKNNDAYVTSYRYLFFIRKYDNLIDSVPKINQKGSYARAFNPLHVNDRFVLDFPLGFLKLFTLMNGAYLVIKINYQNSKGVRMKPFLKILPIPQIDGQINGTSINEAPDSIYKTILPIIKKKHLDKDL